MSQPFPRVSRALALVCLAASAWLTGCETYQTVYTPPPTEAGRMCLTQCSGIRQSCEMNANAMKQNCDMAYNDRMRQYESCERMYGRPQPVCTAWNASGQCTSTRYPQSPCVRPTNTCSSNTSQCESNYNACYSNCGGRVDRIKVN